MVTVSSQTLPMMRRKGSYRLRRPSRYKTSWSSGGVGSGSGGGSSQNLPPNPHGSPNSLMQAAVARLDLPRPHLVYIGSTGSTGRIRPQQPSQGPPLLPAPTSNPTSRPQRPRRLLDPSVPVRIPPSTSSLSSSGPPSSATPPAMPFQPAAAPGPLTNLAEEPLTATSTRQYSTNRTRSRSHNRGRKTCLRRPLGCELGCAGACLPGWKVIRTLLTYTFASVACYGCLVLINAYLDYVYNKEAMRNLLLVVIIIASVFAFTRICRVRVMIRLFDPDGMRLQYRAGSSSPLLVSRRDGRQLCRPARCSSGRHGHVPTSRSGGVETDGGDADIEDDPDIEQGQSLVPPSTEVPTGATDDDDDDGGIGGSDIAGADSGTPDPDAASTSAGTPPPPPYAAVVGGSSSPPPSYDKVVQ